MKRLSFLFLILYLLCGVCSAEDEVWLDVNTPDIRRFNTGSLNFDNPEKADDEENENYLKPSFHSIKKMFNEDFFEQKSFSTKKDKENL